MIDTQFAFTTIREIQLEAIIRQQGHIPDTVDVSLDPAAYEILKRADKFLKGEFADCIADAAARRAFVPILTDCRSRLLALAEAKMFQREAGEYIRKAIALRDPETEWRRPLRAARESGSLQTAGDLEPLKCHCGQPCGQKKITKPAHKDMAPEQDWGKVGFVCCFAGRGRGRAPEQDAAEQDCQFVCGESQEQSFRRL